MTNLDIFWESASRKSNKLLIFNAEIINHRRIDIAGRASSILVTPAIENPVNIMACGIPISGGDAYQEV